MSVSAETPQPQPGDTARVVIEGRVLKLDDHGRVMALKMDGESAQGVYVPAVATVEVLERADAPKVGELRRENHEDDSGRSIWQVQENYDGERFWCCVYSTAPGNRDVHFPLDSMLDLPVVGYVPGSPAAYAAATRPSVRVPNEPHGPSPTVRILMANRIAEGRAVEAVGIAHDAGMDWPAARAYVESMSEYRTYLAAHGERRGSRVFLSDGPEPPADVELLRFFGTPARVNGLFLRRSVDLQLRWVWLADPEADVSGMVGDTNWPVPNVKGTFTEEVV